MRFAVDYRAYFEVMFRIELLHLDDPDLDRARDRSNRVLYAGMDEEAAEAAPRLAAWSLVHGFAVLLMAGNFDDEVAADPEAAVREIAAQLNDLPGTDRDDRR